MKPRIRPRGGLWHCEWRGYNALGASMEAAYWNLDDLVRSRGQRLPLEAA